MDPLFKTSCNQGGNYFAPYAEASEMAKAEHNTVFGRIVSPVSGEPSAVNHVNLDFTADSATGQKEIGVSSRAVASDEDTSDAVNRKPGLNTFVGRINYAFEELDKQNFSNAERLFRGVYLEEDLDELEYHRSLVGLARSLVEQNTYKKLTEAQHHLQVLRGSEWCTTSGASIIPDLDITLSRCEQELGLPIQAEARLLTLRRKSLHADEKAMCEPSDNYHADIAMVRQWQLMKKPKLALTLLQNMRAESTLRLTKERWPSSPACAAIELHECLKEVNMMLATLSGDGQI
ncbi:MULTISPECIES: hypothetical protein [unclassified Endozoicomonas]|uniref:hypothetical protein n=1 Tax=unclassified Endozoicomonas TaxID=2644528 RepID=UPI003BB5DD14